MSSYLAEFLGTTLLVLIGDGVCANNTLEKTKSHNGGPVMILLGWCLAVGVPAGLFGDVSGGHFNPVFTIGLAIAGLFPWNHVLGYIIAQMAGGFLGAVMVWFFYYNHFQNSPSVSAEDKLAIFTTTPAIRNYFFNTFSELLATMVLIFSLFGLSSKTPVAGVSTFNVAAGILMIGTGLGGTTGFSLNPARDFSPRLAHAILPIQGKGSSDWAYSWVPIVGPLIGATIGAFLYKAVF